MPWKFEENGGFAKCEKGNPIWVDGSEERSVDFPAMGKALQDASEGEKKWRKDLRALQDKFKGLADVDDVDGFLTDARAALEMVKNAPDKDKAIEEQVATRVKANNEANDAKIKAKDAVITERDKAIAELSAQLERESVKHAFFQSAYVRDKLSSATMVEKLFAGNFSLTENGLEGKGEDGKTIYGDDGAVASFDVALAKLVEASPDKGLLYKVNNQGGSGANPNSRGGDFTANPWKKETLNVTQQMKIAAENPARAKALMKEAGVPIPANF